MKQFIRNNIKQNYKFLLSILFMLIFSQFYFHITKYVITQPDFSQDIAIVIGNSFNDILFDIFQHYMFGYLPLFISWFGLKFFNPLDSFYAITTILTGLFSIIIFLFIYKFINTKLSIKLFLASTMSYLLISPTVPFWSWKTPYTLAAPMGILSVMYLLYVSFYIVKSCNLKNLSLYFTLAILGISTKLEFAVSIIALSMILFFFIYKELISHKKEFFFFITYLFIIFIIAFLNWNKFLPNDFVGLSFFPKSLLFKVISLGQLSGSFIEYTTGIKILTLYQLYHMATNILFFLILHLLKQFKFSTPFFKRTIKCLLYFFLTIHSLDYMLSSPYDFFDTVNITILFIILLNINKFKRNKFFVLLIFTSFIISSRVFVNTRLYSYGLFYMPLSLILFFILIYGFYEKSIAYLYTLFLFIMNISFSNYEFREYVAYRNLAENFPPIKCNNGKNYELDNFFFTRLINELQTLKPKLNFKNITSAKQIPFLNTCFELPTLNKTLPNSEPYAFVHDYFFDKYFDSLAKNIPDIYILSQNIIQRVTDRSSMIGNYASLSCNEFTQRMNLFKSELKKIFKFEYSIDSKKPYKCDFYTRYVIYSNHPF